MKLLRTIRFDVSDTFVFDKAAEPGEWAVPGAFAFAHLAADDLKGKTRQAFANGFLGLSSFGRSTFATVGEALPEDEAQMVEMLASHFIEAWGAPTLDEAREVARDEVAFVADLVKDADINTVFALRRSFDGDGGMKEEFRTLQKQSLEDQHANARIWSVVDDEA